jgi:hypothetical protein
MGFFGGPSKKERRELATRLEAHAERETADAKKLKADAAKVRQADRNALYPDPAATRAITRYLEANRRIAELNAEELRQAANEMKRSSKRWF